MAQIHLRDQDWFILAERGALRLLMVVFGMMLIVVGLGMCMSVVLLLPGLVFELVGVCLVVGGMLEQIPIGGHRLKGERPPSIGRVRHS